jgi:GAF domain-containing protein
MRELAPRHEQWWFDVYGRVARTGEPTRFESLASSLGPRWFDVFACRVGEPDDAMVAIMFSDITTSKQAQDALNSAELAAAADLAVMTRLQAVATRLLGPGELDSMLAELLATSDGIRAFQTSPLISRDGRPLGVLNNHFVRPHRLSPREQRYLDLLARMAADLTTAAMPSARCASPTAGRTSSWPRWRMSCAIRWRRCATACRSRGCAAMPTMHCAATWR